ncbi:MAG: response regulator [Chitinispirillales bacterium]|jgi:signal transduction histidine kinase/FixJ family two-component response regulator/HPt (histidine-containing phosphotransfer) domain-containing protein|nr:response regulator [Chitinispirillales bacterium]
MRTGNRGADYEAKAEKKTLDPKLDGKRGTSTIHEFIAFSIMLFLIILVAGGAAFVFSMRQIIRTNKGNELLRMMENERIRLETFVNNEITIAMKMAESPLIKRYFENPDVPELESMAIEEIAAYRGSTLSTSVFWISDKDKMFYMDDNDPYAVDPEAPENGWYNKTLYKTRTYNFDIHYNPALKMTKLWINAPVLNRERTSPLGIVGVAIDITAFVKRLYEQYKGRAELYYFNAEGEITGAHNVEIVVNKEHIEKFLGVAGVGVQTRALRLKEGEIITYDSPSGEVAIGPVPALGWYAVAIMPDTISDYKNPVAVVFLLMLLLIALIIVIFNVFIAGFLKSLRRTMDSLETSARYKSEFLAMMSHEIRTPMNAILGMAELAMREKELPRAQEHVLTIRKSGMNLLSIINDILDFSKIESGKMDIVPVDYHLISLIKDVTSIIGIKAAESRLEFRVSVDDRIPQALVGDEVRIRQIILNILSNAVKYTSKGFVALTVKGTRIDDDTVNITIEVADSGRGIKQEDIGKLFKDFVQIDLVKNKGIEGTGLGLAITRSLVKAMGGAINVRSKYGKGSVFTVVLPQKISKQRDFADEMTTAVFTAPTAKALIVDDVQTNLVVAQGLLSFYGMVVHTCLSGAEAIEAVKAEDYDLVFMDHMMPEMDGIEAAMRIRNLGRRYTKLPIIALTANAVSGMKQMFKRNGFNDYLSKPIDTAKLNAVLERWIPKNKQIRMSEAEAAAARSTTVTNTPIVAEIAIGGVDTAKGLSTVRGNAESYLQVLSVFYKDGQAKLAEINNALCASDLRLYTTYVHALKSASANIGATQLSEIALALETAGKEGNRAYIDEYTPRLVYDLKLLLLNIGNFLKANADKSQSGAAIDTDAMKRTLNKLKEAISAVAIGDMRAAMKELQPYASSNNPIAAQVDAILQCTLGGRYDEAVGLIEAVIGILG